MFDGYPPRGTHRRWVPVDGPFFNGLSSGL